MQVLQNTAAGWTSGLMLATPHPSYSGGKLKISQWLLCLFQHTVMLVLHGFTYI